MNARPVGNVPFEAVHPGAAAYPVTKRGLLEGKLKASAAGVGEHNKDRRQYADEGRGAVTRAIKMNINTNHIDSNNYRYHLGD